MIKMIDVSKECTNLIKKLVPVGFKGKIIVYKKSKKSFISFFQKSTIDSNEKWKKVLSDFFEEETRKYNSRLCYVNCTTLNNNIDFDVNGRYILKGCWPYIQDCDIFMVDITIKDSNPKLKFSFILARDEGLKIKRNFLKK